MFSLSPQVTVSEKLFDGLLRMWWFPTAFSALFSCMDILHEKPFFLLVGRRKEDIEYIGLVFQHTYCVIDSFLLVCR